MPVKFAAGLIAIVVFLFVTALSLAEYESDRVTSAQLVCSFGEDLTFVSPVFDEISSEPGRWVMTSEPPMGMTVVYAQAPGELCYAVPENSGG